MKTVTKEQITEAKRKIAKIDEILDLMAEFEYCMAGDIGKVITKLERFKEEEL